MLSSLVSSRFQPRTAILFSSTALHNAPPAGPLYAPSQHSTWRDCAARSLFGEGRSG
jgi:hypothetical protein